MIGVEQKVYKMLASDNELCALMISEKIKIPLIYIDHIPEKAVNDKQPEPVILIQCLDASPSFYADGKAIFYSVNLMISIGGLDYSVVGVLEKKVISILNKNLMEVAKSRSGDELNFGLTWSELEFIGDFFKL